MRLINQTLQKIFLFGALTGLPAENAAALDREMARFAADKETLAREFAETQTQKVPAITWSFFDAVRVDDWETASNLFSRLRQFNTRQPAAESDSSAASLQTAVWPPVWETFHAYQEFHNWDNKLLHRFGRMVMATVPARSIYFSGTETSRYIVSALSESHRDGEPFFTLGQNQLADATYLEYLRRIYGTKIYVPTVEDSQRIFQDYITDAQARLKAGRLKPGEDVRIVDNRVQVSGQVAVSEINARLIRFLVEKNPGREIFLDEGYPLDWAYPHLWPEGLVFRLNPSPLLALSAETVRKNNEYWRQFAGELVGGWLNEKTSVKEVCEFAEKAFRQKKTSGFRSDPAFLDDREAQECFSKLRGSIGGLYVWRAKRAKDDDERARMNRAAEFAYRQAFALCPRSSDAVIRYGRLLMDLKRTDDALLLAKTSLQISPDNPHARSLIRSLNRTE